VCCRLHAEVEAALLVKNESFDEVVEVNLNMSLRHLAKGKSSRMLRYIVKNEKLRAVEVALPCNRTLNQSLIVCCGCFMGSVSPADDCGNW
jgi:hypothetical protein